MKTLVATAAIACIAAGSARADNKSRADELFRRAKQLLADHRYAEACPKFEESYQLDPGIGGELNIGRCYEEWGKLGHAYRAYQEAERQAKAAHDAREGKIHELVTGLDAEVPRIAFHVPPGVDPATVTVSIDGQPVSGDLSTPQIVDPGPKQIDYTIAGVHRQKIVPIERGGSADVTLEPPAPPAPVKPIAPAVTPPTTPPPATNPEPETSDEHPGRSLHLAGITVGSLGVIGVAVGSYLALSARSDYRAALRGDCGGMTDACDAYGLSKTHDARSRANVATGVFAGGLALVAGGIAMYLLAPHASQSEHAFYVAPTGTGLAFGGQY